MGFAGIDALDDFLNGLVFDQQVADFDGRQDLANQIRSWDFHAIEADAICKFIYLVYFKAVTREDQALPLGRGPSTQI